MDEQTKKTLGQILDVFDAKQEAAKQAAVRQKTEREIFLDSFYRKITSLIRPHFEEIGASLKSRGHEFEIAEEKEAFEGSGKLKTRAGVSLSIYPNGVRPGYANRNDCPRIGFYADSYKTSVNAHECTMMPGRGGQAGGAGEYSLDSITSDIIDKHVISVLSKAMGGK